MVIRRIKICISRGWYRVVYGVSFLALSLLCSCSSSKAVSKGKVEGSKGVEASKGMGPADCVQRTDSLGVTVVNLEDFQSLGIETPDEPFK